MRQVRTFQGRDQQLVEVYVIDTWFEGIIRAWRQDANGDWSAQVTWSTGPGHGNYLDIFAAEDVREIDEQQWWERRQARRAAAED